MYCCAYGVGQAICFKRSLDIASSSCLKFICELINIMYIVYFHQNLHELMGLILIEAFYSVLREVCMRHYVLICCQEKYAVDVGLSDRDMIPIFISIAQTFSDLKKYDDAITYFMKELDCRHGEHKQV